MRTCQHFFKNSGSQDALPKSLWQRVSLSVSVHQKTVISLLKLEATSQIVMHRPQCCLQNKNPQTCTNHQLSPSKPSAVPLKKNHQPNPPKPNQLTKQQNLISKLWNNRVCSVVIVTVCSFSLFYLSDCCVKKKLFVILIIKLIDILKNSLQVGEGTQILT